MITDMIYVPDRPICCANATLYEYLRFKLTTDKTRGSQCLLLFTNIRVVLQDTGS